MPILEILITPLNYLRIHHSIKRLYDIYIPVAFVVALWIIFSILPVNDNIPVFSLVTSKITDICAVLTGFCFAALAAVATFPSDNLDKCFEGEKATLKRTIRGQVVKEELTRRRFLSYLFGYLTFSCLLLFLYPDFSKIFTLPDTLNLIFKFMYSVFSVQIAITFLIGLHYLTDRIHRP